MIFKRKNKNTVAKGDGTESELEELLYQQTIDICRSNRNLFTENILKDRGTGKSIKQAKIHKAMQYAFDNYQRVLVVISRNSGKTTQSLSGMLYEIGTNRNVVIKIISDRDTTAMKRVSVIKQHLEHNKRFKEIFPEVRPLTTNKFGAQKESWGKTSLTVNREIIDLNSTISACGVLSQGVGDRADLLVFDDPCNLRNSILYSALREQVMDAYYSVWLPLLNEQGRIWYFGTPFHKDDLTSVLREKWREEPNCCVLDLHVGQKLEITSEGEVVSVTETDDDCLPIWPEGFSREFFEQQKRTMTKQSYNRAYLCKAVSADDLIFKLHDVEACKDYSFGFLDNIDELEEVE